jgi:hypothetical protein
MPAAVRPLAGTVAAVLGLVAALGLTACGSSGGSSSAPSAPAAVPKAQVVSQGDAFCKERDDRLDALTQPTSKDPKALATYLRSGTAVAEEATNKIAALGQPDRDAPVLASYLDAQRQQFTRVRQIADQIERGDVQGGAAALNGSDPLGDKLKADAKAFGFTVCAD